MKTYGDEGTRKTIKRSIQWRMKKLWITVTRMRNLGASTSWTPQGLSRPVMGLLYLYKDAEKICNGARRQEAKKYDKQKRKKERKKERKEERKNKGRKKEKRNKEKIKEGRKEGRKKERKGRKKK